METPFIINLLLYLFRVLTVPMRNGNDVYVKKLGQFIRVLTVPMRNGNIAKANNYKQLQWFLPYL